MTQASLVFCTENIKFSVPGGGGVLEQAHSSGGLSLVTQKLQPDPQ